MPIDLATVLKQIGRNSSQNGPINTFYYLVDTADIDYRVEGRLGSSGLLPDNAAPQAPQYGQKYIILDPDTLPAELGGSGALIDTPGIGDIIERREDGWYIHLDVSDSKTNGGALAYSKHDKKFYYYKNGTGWVELGAGSLTGAAGTTWSIQFRATDGSLSGDAGLLFNNQTNQLVLGSDVVIAFGDGTTQGTARNFFGVTGPTTQRFPIGMSGAGNTGDRLLIATGPSADPFRNYVRFGTGWFQTGVVGIGQGPQGIQGTAGNTGTTGETGAKGDTGATGSTGFGFTAAQVSGDGNLYISILFPDGTSGQERSIGFVRGSTGFTGPTGSTGFGFTAAFVSGDGNLYISTLFPDGTSGQERSIGFVRGSDGARGSTGSTGSTGFGFTAAFVSGDGNLYISTLFPDGTSGQERSIGFVRGADGATGVTGVTGTTGTTGATGTTGTEPGISIDGAFISYGSTTITFTVPNSSTGLINLLNKVADTSTDGSDIYLTPIRQSGTDSRVVFSSDKVDKSVGPTDTVFAFSAGAYNAGSSTTLAGQNVRGFFIPYIRGSNGAAGARGATGTTGATGSTGFGFTAAFVSGDGNLYISTLFPSGTSGNERSIGFVRGSTGATGTFSIGLSVGSPYTYADRVAQFVANDVGKARKFAFLLEDGSLTFDYVKNIDIFSKSDFEFAPLSLVATNFDTTRLLKSTFYDLSSSTFNASYRLGPPGTAFILGDAETNPILIYFPTAGMTTVSGSGISLTGTGGPNYQTAFSLIASGTNSDGSPSGSKNINGFTVYFSNDYLVGMTAASVITGGGAGTTGVNGAWLQRDYTSSNPVNRTLSGYTKSVTASASENYIYFGYPSRIHNESSPPQFYLYPVGSSPGFPGGMVLQGFGNAFDEGGLSTINYTNLEGYVEPYKVWRSEQSFGQNTNMTIKVG